MKKSLILLLLFGASTLWAQENASINDFNFESVSNPAFTLLDESPTQIYTPDNIKSLALYLSNGFENTNIAVELNPYWYIDFEGKRSYRKFRGIKKNAQGEDVIDPFIGLKTDWSVSLGYLNKTFTSIDTAKNVAGIGARTTIVKLYSKDRVKKVNDAISKVEVGVTDRLNEAFEFFYTEDNNKPGSGTCEEINTDQELKNQFLQSASDFLERDDTKELLQQMGLQSITAEEVVTRYFKERCELVESFVNNPKNVRPNFRLDGAIGYSVLFKDNEFNTSTANRFGTWLTADVALGMAKDRYLHILAIGKYIDDGFQLDANGQYTSTSFWDYGAKVELEFDKFTFSYEYLERSGDDDQFRSVGNITYQINTNFSLVGGFGKDFPEDDNLVSILGINWGLNSGEKSFNQQ
ncbi:hypothetical protein POV27_00070 [Aureisphaera galaxeae]|uniref:hypothetical protein n=1 Tax=Aureisphaera galaxeae TaxID=1538023 RepID=UPI002350F83B|nr:hypothetical protein [Aureisphaera galaxeae]MDC8002431.1 hypothetical protein [Aureisphaera galaxeae]